jgi:hypothetical protein
MFQFYYDFVDVFVDRRDSENCAMDTDSAYIALFADTLEEAITPDLRQVHVPLYSSLNSTGVLLS